MKKLFLLGFLLAGISSFAQETTIQPTEDNNIYSKESLDAPPEFVGGMQKFYMHIAKNFRVPEVKGAQGTIYSTFVIEKDGSLSDIKVIKDVGYGTAEETLRVLKSCPNWKPGMQNGKIVRTQYSLPINISSAAE